MTIRYVNTASTAGGDGTTNNTTGATRAYATLRAALDGLPATLLDAYTIYCDGSGGADTSDCDQTPWDFVTSATNYLLITTQGSARHTGKWTTGAYRMTRTNANGLYNNTPCHVRLDGLQVQITVNDASSPVAFKLANANQTLGTIDVRISNCIARGIQTSGTVDAFVSRPFGSGGAGTSKIWNCLAYDCNNGFIGEFVTTEVYNCTAHSCAFGYIANATNGMKAINCLNAAQSSIGFVAGGTFASGSKNNASSDATAPGTSARNDQTFTFVDAANDDFHLASTDAGAKDFGFDDPGAGLFSDDIDGNPRVSPWDIGADEYYIVSPGLGALVLTGASPTRRVDYAASLQIAPGTFS